MIISGPQSISGEIIKSMASEPLAEKRKREEGSEEDSGDVPNKQVSLVSVSSSDEEEMSEEESERLQKYARKVGYIKFLEENLRTGMSVLDLFRAFKFPVDEKLFYENPKMCYTYFIRYLKRFCENRQRIPELNRLEDAVDLLKTSKRIVVLTGAGISVSCGIPDFRSQNGLYSLISEKYPDLEDPQQMFDIEYFEYNHLPFFDVAKRIFPSNFKPSKTHFFIKMLEDKGVLLRNYTQNIDTLEKIAGITKVVHCHGSFDTASCLRCKRKVDGDEIKDDILNRVVPYCTKCTTNKSSDDINEIPPIMKPDIVFFGEKLPDEFERYVHEDQGSADLLIIIGSSLKVAPVSNLVGFFPHYVPVILINKEPVHHFHDSFDIQLLGYCDDIVDDLCMRAGWNKGTPKEPTRIEPNIYLYDGAVFDETKHQKIMAGDVQFKYSSDYEDLESVTVEDTETETTGQHC